MSDLYVTSEHGDILDFDWIPAGYLHICAADEYRQRTFGVVEVSNARAIALLQKVATHNLPVTFAPNNERLGGTFVELTRTENGPLFTVRRLCARRALRLFRMPLTWDCALWARQVLAKATALQPLATVSEPVQNTLQQPVRPRLRQIAGAPPGAPNPDWPC
jgi:hypothetical protein